MNKLAILTMVVTIAIAIAVSGKVDAAAATAEGSFGDTTCRSAPIPKNRIALAKKRQTTPADSDGITRTYDACKDVDGATCEICCDGVCCEIVNTTTANTALTSSSSSSEQVWIPIRFIVIISASTTTSPVDMSQVTYQLAVVNKAFEKTKFRFIYHSVEVFRDNKMYSSCNTDSCYTTDDCDFYAYTLPKVRVDSEKVINVVICAVSYLGEAQWPWATVENNAQQYVQIGLKAWANRGVSHQTTYGHGKTMVHELGHYMGLLHTFAKKNECDQAGDFVADTPRAKLPADQNQACGTQMDTCPSSPGNDDHGNYMNYAKDECMTYFSTGQISRMYQAVTKYRPLLLKNSMAKGSCPTSTSHVANCTCSDSTKTLASFCGKQVSNYFAQVSPNFDNPTTAPVATEATTTTTTIVAAPGSAGDAATGAPAQSFRVQGTGGSSAGSTSTVAAATSAASSSTAAPRPATPRPPSPTSKRSETTKEKEGMSNEVIVTLACVGAVLLLALTVGISVWCARRIIRRDEKRLQKYMQPRGGTGGGGASAAGFQEENPNNRHVTPEIADIDDAELDHQFDDVTAQRHAIPLPGFGTRPVSSIRGRGGGGGGGGGRGGGRGGAQHGGQYSDHDEYR